MPETLRKDGQAGVMKLNDFNKDLQYSFESSEDKLLNDFYRWKYPNLKEIIPIKNNMKLQKAGVDKVIVLKNGKKLKIDEKKRRKDYGDILLEEWSVLHAKKKGWTGDPAKITDYVVYAILPANTLYWLPYDLLQFTWRTNYYKWKKKYGIKKAFNRSHGGYITTNIAVPLNILLEALKVGMCCKVTPGPNEEAIFEEKLFLDKEAGYVKDNFESLGSIITRKGMKKKRHWQEQTLFSKYQQPLLF